MIDLSHVSRGTWRGRLLRVVLNALPLPDRVRILQGPLRGSTWLRASGTNGCWLGTYEIEKQRAVNSALRPGETFYDIGAHAGLYTLLAGKRVGPMGSVVAFEPDPRNQANLERHIALNQLANVNVVRAAVGATTGMASFDVAESAYENRISATGSARVRCYALDDAVAVLGLPLPDCIKIDVEGGEEDVLRGASATLARARPVVFLATHSPEIHRRCGARLQSMGYSLRGLSGPLWDADEEIIAVAPRVG